MSKSIAKRFVTSSALILTVGSPIIASDSPIGAVFAKGESVVKTTQSDSVNDRLTKAINNRDIAYKNFVDAKMDYISAEKTLKDLNNSTESNVYSEAKSTYDKAKNRLATSETSLRLAQSAVDALKVEAKNDKSNTNLNNTSDDTSINSKSKDVVKSARIDYVDVNGKAVDSLNYDLSNLENLVQLAKTSGVKSDVSVKSILDSEKSKLETLVGKNRTVVLASGRYSLTKVVSTFDKGDYVIEVVVKNVDDVKNTSESKTLDKESTQNVNTNSSTDSNTTTTSNVTEVTTASEATVSSQSSDKSSSASTTTEVNDSKVESKGQMSNDGILTDMIFVKSDSAVLFKGMIDKSKLSSDQKLEGDFAKVIISKADGTELATLSVDNDYKFSGNLKSEPKEGERLIVKYGGNIYEIGYTLDLNKKVVESKQSPDTSSESQTQAPKQNVKAGLLPSTGQQNLLVWTVSGIMMIAASVGAFLYKFKLKKDVGK